MSAAIPLLSSCCSVNSRTHKNLSSQVIKGFVLNTDDNISLHLKNSPEPPTVCNVGKQMCNVFLEKGSDATSKVLSFVLHLKAACPWSIVQTKTCCYRLILVAFKNPSSMGTLYSPVKCQLEEKINTCTSALEQPSPCGGTPSLCLM